MDNRSRNAFQFANNNNHSVTINKNFIIKSGVFNFSGAYTKSYRLNIKGGFIQNGGIVSHQSASGSSGIFTMNFTGDSSFIYRTSGTYRSIKINYSVDSNAKFYMTRRMQIPIGRSFTINGTLLCDTFVMFGSGAFILQPNAYMYIGADSGIYRVGSRKGNITTLLRTYSNNANYIYYGKNINLQVMGFQV